MHGFYHFLNCRYQIEQGELANVLEFHDKPIYRLKMKLYYKKIKASQKTIQKLERLHDDIKQRDEVAKPGKRSGMQNLISS